MAILTGGMMRPSQTGMNLKRNHLASGWARASLAVVGICLAGLPQANALQPSTVPNDLPAAQRTSFLQGKADLERERDNLLRRIEAHNARCPKDMPDDSPNLPDCRREQQSLNNAQTRYLENVRAFNLAVAQAVSQRPRGNADVAANIAKLEKQIASDEEAIRRLGFQKRAADFEEWSKLTDAARNQFINETLRILARLALDEAALGLKSHASDLSSSLTREKAKDVIKWLERNGANNPHLVEAIEALARATTIKERTDAANALISATSAAVKTYSVASSSDKLKATVEVFCETASQIGSKKLGLVGWQTRALVAGAELTAELSFAYAEQHIAESTIRDLDHMTEEQLKAVQKLSDVLRKHVAELKAAKRRL